MLYQMAILDRWSADDNAKKEKRIAISPNGIVSFFTFNSRFFFRLLAKSITPIITLTAYSLNIIGQGEGDKI